jgi:hypothetical protein
LYLDPACRAHELALTFVLLQQSRQTPNLLLQQLDLFVFEGEILFQRSIRVSLQQLADTPEEVAAVADVLESSVKQPLKDLLKAALQVCIFQGARSLGYLHRRGNFAQSQCHPQGAAQRPQAKQKDPHGSGLAG